MIDHFTYGLWTPVIAYAVSVIGAFIGLTAATRSRNAVNGFTRMQWLVMSAICLGGTAVWSMHFIAMMGFRVSGTPIRYDTGLTLASGAVAILVMGVALYLTIHRDTTGWLIVGGLIAGTGIVSMHYMGMASMNLHGELHHNPVFVTAATAIALAAAVAALWFARRLTGLTAITLASLLMGVAVSSMHYTGMFGMSATVHADHPMEAPAGATSSELLLPLVVGLFVFLLVCSLFLMLGVEDSPRRRAVPSATAPEQESGENREGGEYAPRHIFDSSRNDNR